MRLVVSCGITRRGGNNDRLSTLWREVISLAGFARPFSSRGLKRTGATMKIKVRSLAIALAIAIPIAVTVSAKSSAAPINGTSIKATARAVTTDVRYKRGGVMPTLRTGAIPAIIRTGAIPAIIRTGAIRPIILTMEPTTTDITAQLARRDRASAPLRQHPGLTRGRVCLIDKIPRAHEGWRVLVANRRRPPGDPRSSPPSTYPMDGFSYCPC